MPPDPTAALDSWYGAGDVNGRVTTTQIDSTTMAVTAVDKNPAVGGSLAFVTYDDLREEICGHTVGKHFTFGLNHDWGAVAGHWVLLTGADADASEYEGFAFWGLSLYDSSIELNLSDIHSATPQTEAEIPQTCIPDVIPDSKEPNPDFVDANGVPKSNSCGSLFSRRLVMQRSWTLYTIPFSDFIQIIRDPRFKPDGLDTSAMRQFSLRVPKDAFVDVSLANPAWYRHKPTN